MTKRCAICKTPFTGPLIQICCSGICSKLKKSERDKINRMRRDMDFKGKKLCIRCGKEKENSRIDKVCCKSCAHNAVLRNKTTVRKNYNHKWSQSSYRRFLQCKLNGIKSLDRRHKHVRKNDLDIDFLMNLLELQDYKCAITGRKMTHKCRDLKAASIDRIDSTKGHTKDNVQLVCWFINLGKSNHSDQAVRMFIREIKLDLLRKLKDNGYLVARV